MRLADTDLNKMSGSAMTIAQKPNVRCHLRILHIRHEAGTDFDMVHTFGETPDALRRKIMPMVWCLLADPAGKPDISNPHDVMCSRHVLFDRHIIGVRDAM